MNKTTLLFLFILLCNDFSIAQTGNNPIQLNDILNGAYASEDMSEIRSLPDGEHYTVLSSDKKAILKYAYKTGKITDTLFHVDKARETKLANIDGYAINSTGFRILVWTDKESVYRHSWKANMYDYDTRRNFLKPLSDTQGKLMAPLFSPDGKMCAFVRDNNIWLKKFDYDTESQITKDGEFGKILNGVTDWVYEEEFSTTGLTSWSADSKFLAFVKSDESNVPLYRFQVFDGAPYTGFYEYKYPKPGENNSAVGVYVYNTDTKTIRKMNIPMNADGYIPAIRFTENIDQLAVMTLNRNQNRFDMYYANPRSTVARLIFRDENKYYINPDWISAIRFSKDHFLYVSEKDGFAHIYLYAINGIRERQVTSGNWDVTALYGFNPETKTVYYQSAEENPLRRSVYKVDAKGVKTRLSAGEGTNSATFSRNFQYFVNYFSNTATPTIVTLHDEKGKQLRVLNDNQALRNTLQTLLYVEKEFFTFSNSSGDVLNGWMMKPVDFNPARKYPVLMVQYSGPNSQTVLDRYEMNWTVYLAGLGYIVVAVDGRGTGARGEVFRKCTGMQLGVYESDDQIAGAKYLSRLNCVDKDRIAIWGWSYGGYNVLMSMSRGNGIFKAGVAIAPVTDWRFYDSVYTERFMKTPQQNENGYNISSPLKLAAGLQGRLLLVHGTSDDNVHFTNAIYYMKALEKEGKMFDTQIYPDKNHNLSGLETQTHLYGRIIDFLNRNLL
ncbi:MAG: S9 family peptidase [Dysgonamonadaceae bacterium]|jgi:dipeptidyl-peptidase-4|nr:S9 family peptidase [Dysgonamonadaceae bacterium]